MRFGGYYAVLIQIFFLNLTGKDRGADYSRESLVHHRKSLARAQGWIFFGFVETSLTVNSFWVNCGCLFTFQSEICSYFHVMVLLVSV